MGKRGPVQGAKHEALRRALDAAKAHCVTVLELDILRKAAQSHLDRMDKMSKYNAATWRKRHQSKG